MAMLGNNNKIHHIKNLHFLEMVNILGQWNIQSERYWEVVRN